MKEKEVVTIAFLVVSILVFTMFHMYKRGKPKSVVEKISVIEKIFAFTIFIILAAIVFIWEYIWGEPSIPDYGRYVIPPTRFMLLMVGGITFGVVFELCRHLINLRRKRATDFPLPILALWFLLWIGLVVDRAYRRDAYTPESVYISLMLLGTFPMVACLCLWIYIINRKECRRCMKGTKSPPSTPAT